MISGGCSLEVLSYHFCHTYRSKLVAWAAPMLGEGKQTLTLHRNTCNEFVAILSPPEEVRK